MQPGQAKGERGTKGKFKDTPLKVIEDTGDEH